MGSWTIHPDIEKAETLPAEVYRDQRWFYAQRERVFARSWQFIGDDRPVRVPGAVLPFTLLEGMLDEPLLLSRGEDDTLRCISNVCTHRGNIVVEHGGVMKSLRCRYHGRRFALDGCFSYMPEFDGVAGFPSACDDLRVVALERWGPLLFCSTNPGQSWEDVFGPIRQRLGWLPLEEFRFDPSRSRDYLVRANWALYCDNYLEGFHIPFVYASLNDALDYGSYRTELFPWCNLQLGVAKGGDECFALPKDSPDFGQHIAAYYWWVYPNTMLNFYPWGLSVNVIRPLAPDRTKVSFLSYVWDESKIARGAGAELDRVEREDESIVEAVQRGVGSRIYKRGRYSPAREQGVHHFHRLLSEGLG